MPTTSEQMQKFLVERTVSIKLGMCVLFLFFSLFFFGKTYSSCSSQNMIIHVFETQQTHQNKRSKQWNQTQDRNHQSEIKLIKPIWKKIKTDQPIKPIWNQNQIEPIKWIYPSYANQTHHQSHPHPAPPNSHIKLIKPTSDQPIKPIADQPIHHYQVPKSRN